MENQVYSPESREDMLTDHVDTLRQIEMEGYELGVRKGRKSLYWIAGLMLAGGLLIAATAHDWNLDRLALIVLLALVFAGLGALTYKKPYMALVTGMTVYIGLWGFNTIYNLKMGSSGVVSVSLGLVVRIIFLVFLARALPDARKLERLRKEVV